MSVIITNIILGLIAIGLIVELIRINNRLSKRNKLQGELIGLQDTIEKNKAALLANQESIIEKQRDIIDNQKSTIELLKAQLALVLGEEDMNEEVSDDYIMIDDED